MSNLINQVHQHLNDNVIIQLSKQIGAQDPNMVKKAAGGVTELLVEAMSPIDLARTGGAADLPIIRLVLAILKHCVSASLRAAPY